MTSSVAANELLRIYMEKNAVWKAFSHIKLYLELFFSRSEGGTKARLSISVLGYTLTTIMAEKCCISHNRALKTLSSMREVVYSDGSHSYAEYTKKQMELMEKLKIGL